ncbi:MAG TPA: flagellar hook-basal body complex protein FliE [Rhodospirillales bacterium]|nr:flagellar hook-basal body complex protein FliE [Rhodospirillales bacterium]
MSDLTAARSLAGTAASALAGSRPNGGTEAATGSTFAAFLKSRLESAEATLRTGESVSTQGLLGKADVQSVVEAVTAAELTLKEVTAIRDRVVAAYQEIMRMPI